MQRIGQDADVEDQFLEPDEVRNWVTQILRVIQPMEGPGTPPTPAVVTLSMQMVTGTPAAPISVAFVSAGTPILSSSRRQFDQPRYADQCNHTISITSGGAYSTVCCKTGNVRVSARTVTSRRAALRHADERRRPDEPVHAAQGTAMGSATGLICPNGNGGIASGSMQPLDNAGINLAIPWLAR